jgi:anti-sigma B factor antagonist
MLIYDGRNMKILVRTLDNVTVLDLEGNFALDGNPQFRKCAAAEIERGARKLIVDLAKVPYMDSSGLGELISCYTSLRKVNGRMKLTNVHSRLRHLLVITKLITVFELFDTEAAAVASFATDPGLETQDDLKTSSAPVGGA